MIKIKIMHALIAIVSLCVMASCVPVAPGVQATPVARSAIAVTLLPTHTLTPAPAPATTPTLAPTSAPDLVAFETKLKRALNARDFDVMAGLMDDPFTFGELQSEAIIPRSDAILKMRRLLVQAGDMTFEPYDVKGILGWPEVSPRGNRLVGGLKASGWGAHGDHEALIAIYARADGGGLVWSLIWVTPTLPQSPPTREPMTVYAGDASDPNKRFRVNYDTREWTYLPVDAADRKAVLENRSIKHCFVWLQAGPVGTGPAQAAKVGEIEWQVGTVQPSIILYVHSPTSERAQYIVGLFLPRDYVPGSKSQCEREFEKVLETFRKY